MLYIYIHIYSSNVLCQRACFVCRFILKDILLCKYFAVISVEEATERFHRRCYRNRCKIFTK